MTAGAIRAGKAVVEASIDDKNFGPRLKMLEAKLMGFGKGIQSIGQRLKGFGSSMAMGSVLASIPAALSINQFMKFDDAMRAVGAVSQATSADLERLRENALELGRTTSWTNEQVANLQLELARAGFSPDEIIDSTGAILNLARVTQTELPRAGEIAANVMRMMGIQAGEMGRVVDVVAAASNSSSQTIEDYFEAIKYAGPAAAQTGLSLEQVSAAIGVMADQGIKGSMAGTSLRNIMLRLATASGPAADHLQALGVSAVDAAGNLRNPIVVLAEMKDAMTELGYGSADVLKVMTELFEVRGAQGALSLMKALDKVESLENKILEMNGYAARVSAEMEAGIGGAWRRMTSAIEGFATQAGEALSVLSSRVFDVVANMANALTLFVKSNPQIAQMILMLTSGMTLAGVALFGVGTVLAIVGAGIAALTTTISSVIAVVSTVGLPIAAIAAGITAIGAALALVAGIAIAVTMAFVDWGAIWAQLRPAWDSFIGPISSQIENILAMLRNGETAKAAELFMLSIGLGMVKGARSLRQSLIPIWMEIMKANVKAFNWMIRSASDFRQGFIKALTTGEGTELTVSTFLDPVDTALGAVEKMLTERIADLQSQAEKIKNDEYLQRLNDLESRGEPNPAAAPASPADMANAEIQAQLSAMMADREAMVSSIRDGFDRMTAETHGTWSGSAQLPLTRVIDRQVELLESIDTNIDRIASREPAVLDWDE